jgi:hypothetical protein
LRRRRVFAELVPLPRLVGAAVLAPLAARGVELIAAITPERSKDAETVVRACRDAGVEVGIWPMLAERDGRWPNALNVGRFVPFAVELLDRLGTLGLLPDTLAVDLEPPLAEVHRALRGDPRTAYAWAVRSPAPGAVARYRELASCARSAGVRTLATAVPMVVADGSASGWQRALATPVDPIAFDTVSPLAYSSLFEGFSFGLVRRSDALALVEMVARAARRRFGARAGMALGCVGRGLLGYEPTLRDVAELAADVGAARAAGVDDVAVYSVGGMLGRPPWERWLDALVETEPRRVGEHPTRARALAALTTLAARGLSVLAARRELIDAERSDGPADHAEGDRAVDDGERIAEERGNDRQGPHAEVEDA